MIEVTHPKRTSGPGAGRDHLREREQFSGVSDGFVPSRSKAFAITISSTPFAQYERTTAEVWFRCLLSKSANESLPRYDESRSAGGVWGGAVYECCLET
jgi:hypothetical protein